MEDPNSRPAAAKLIDDVIYDHQQQVQRDMLAGEFRAGLSLCMQIYNALKRAGYLKEENGKI
jgi:hypothetical protein